MIHICHHDNRYLIAQSYANRQDVGFGFNMGLHVGDQPKQVLANRAALLGRLMPFGVRRLSWLNQIHSSTSIYERLSGGVMDADALISDDIGVGLAIMTADCVPIALWGGSQIACIHAGHQGLAQGIIKACVNKMTNLPKFAYIGACIGGQNYELPKLMVQTIINHCLNQGLNDERVMTAMSGGNNGKVLLDIGQIARLQLEQLGIIVQNQQIDCTYTGNYHSHRRATHQNGVAGRMAMVIAKLA